MDKMEEKIEELERRENREKEEEKRMESSRLKGRLSDKTINKIARMVEETEKRERKDIVIKRNEINGWSIERVDAKLFKTKSQGEGKDFKL